MNAVVRCNRSQGTTESINDLNESSPQRHLKLSCTAIQCLIIIIRFRFARLNGKQKSIQDVDGLIPATSGLFVPSQKKKKNTHTMICGESHSYIDLEVKTGWIKYCSKFNATCTNPQMSLLYCCHVAAARRQRHENSKCHSFPRPILSPRDSSSPEMWVDWAASKEAPNNQLAQAPAGYYFSWICAVQFIFLKMLKYTSQSHRPFFFLPSARSNSLCLSSRAR